MTRRYLGREPFKKTSNISMGGDMGSIWKRCPEWQVRTHLPALLLALTVAGCFAASPELTKSGKTGDEKGKKVGTGKSFVAETMVALAPAAPPGGWDSERVMSGEDDWEPANAVDPVNPNYVYQLTTRYTGPKPCGDRKSTRLNSSHEWISYAVFCLKKKKTKKKKAIITKKKKKKMTKTI